MSDWFSSAVGNVAETFKPAADNAVPRLKKVTGKVSQEAPGVANQVLQQLSVAKEAAAPVANRVAEQVALQVPVVAAKFAEGTEFAANQVTSAAQGAINIMGPVASKLAKQVATDAPVVADQILHHAQIAFQNLDPIIGNIAVSVQQLDPAILAAVGTGVATLIVAPILASPILGILGFGSIGPIAGSIAAGIQSAIGNVAAGSIFAQLQSVAMGGPMPVLGVLITIVAGGLIGVATYGITSILKPDN